MIPRRKALTPTASAFPADIARMSTTLPKPPRGCVDGMKAQRQTKRSSGLKSLARRKGPSVKTCTRS